MLLNKHLKYKENGQNNRFFQTNKNKESINYCYQSIPNSYAIIIPMTNSNSLNNLQFFFLVLSTIFIAAAGYIINDYFDTRVDRLNNRKLIIDHLLKDVKLFYYTLYSAESGVFLGFYLA